MWGGHRVILRNELAAQAEGDHRDGRDPQYRPVRMVRRAAAGASPDLLRDMIKTFAEALMGADADAVCGAEYRARSTERTNSRNGYRGREWDTRAGTSEVAIPSCARAVTSRIGCSNGV